MTQLLREVERRATLDRQAFIWRSIRASQAVQEALLAQDVALVAIAEALASALAAGRTVFAFGNGGSAAQAQHLVGELVGRLETHRPALALGTDPTALTALANDFGYCSVFRRQITALGRPGDVAVALSTCGSSTSTFEGVAAARARGLVTVALTGAPGGPLADVVDLCLQVPTDETARIEEAHLLAIHLIRGLVDRILLES
jgi:D-sedoheptulose 7-phosphate isomerase